MLPPSGRIGGRDYCGWIRQRLGTWPGVAMADTAVHRLPRGGLAPKPCDCDSANRGVAFGQ